ncbi:polyketide synthase dehydratase domain-containing protein, partial [Burkholderia sp. Ac-20379]|uniref:polyketide synthase dehydratase domain-containing protein n=1 Tax=Burkholderia sp. Ac-20379 TaxID=2703900 RepID=UPI0019822DE8
ACAADDPAARAAHELARAWVAGEDADWAAWQAAAMASGEPAARRIHAPLYPFARERYWMDESLGVKDPEAIRHPLLHRNLSSFDLQRHASRFKGGEFFWHEHRVGDVQILPGMVGLEMARAASEQAHRTEGGEAAFHWRFADLLWARPIRAGAGPTGVEIRLRRAQADAAHRGAASFEIERENERDSGGGSGGGSQAVPHVQGRVERMSAQWPDAAPHPLDLAALRAQATDVLEGADIYRVLTARGMHHGANFQALGKLHRGPDYVLASLKLPRLLHHTLEALPLHPIMLDAAIQAWAGLAGVDLAAGGAAVPFACRAIEVFAPCTSA